MEMWAISEEKLQFTKELKHDINRELIIFDLFKELYLEKLNKIEHLSMNKVNVLEIERKYNELVENPEYEIKLKSKFLGNTK